MLTIGSVLPWHLIDGEVFLAFLRGAAAPVLLAKPHVSLAKDPNLVKERERVRTPSCATSTALWSRLRSSPRRSWGQ